MHKKVLLIPGSFNPLTNAHVDMALTAKKAIDADIAFFIPAHDTYVAQKGTLISGEIRSLMIKGIRELYNNSIYSLNNEIKSLYPPKTYNTITGLKNNAIMEWRFAEYYICLGMDNISTLKTWYNWKKIVEEVNFVACIREGQNLDETLEKVGLTKYKDRFTEIKIPKNHISSSLVRKLCNDGNFDEVKKLVPENVYEYLVEYYQKLGDTDV